MRAILYDSVVIDGKEYDKNKFFEFLIQERKKSNVRYIKKRDGKKYIEYTLMMNLQPIKICFPDFNSHLNDKYEDIICKWASYDRKKQMLRLKIAGALLITGIATAKVVEHSDDIKNFAENQMFYLENIKELASIEGLEAEVRAHGGYGRVDGYSQTLQEHLNGYCSLGKAKTSEVVYQAISEYCDEKGLGDIVSDAACEKYDLFYTEQIDEANEINLKDIYKESKQKTYSK